MALAPPAETPPPETPPPAAGTPVPDWPPPPADKPVAGYTKAEVPPTKPTIGAEMYYGNPSPADIAKTLEEKAKDDTFVQKAKMLRENFGVQSPEQALIALENFVPVTPPAPPPTTP